MPLRHWVEALGTRFWTWVARQVCSHADDSMLRLWESSAELKLTYNLGKNAEIDLELVRKRLDALEVGVPRIRG